MARGAGRYAQSAVPRAREGDALCRGGTFSAFCSVPRAGARLGGAETGWRRHNAPHRIGFRPHRHPGAPGRVPVADAADAVSAAGASSSPLRLLFFSSLSRLQSHHCSGANESRPSPAAGPLALSARRCGDQRNAVGVSIANATDSGGRWAPGSGRGSNDLGLSFVTPLVREEAIARCETARIHYAARRRGGPVAPRVFRAAVEGANHRSAGYWQYKPRRILAGVSAGTTRSRLYRGAEHSI
jgi:hypothetical protein